MTDLVIRRAEPRDFPAIRAIYRAAWTSAYGGIVPQGAIDRVTALSDEAISAVLAEEQPGLFVAEAEGAVAGWIRLAGRLVKSLHVDPARQGIGVGQQLLTYGAGLIGGGAYLVCLSENHRARAFYRSRGWREDGDTVEKIDGVNYPAIRYVAPPAPAAEPRR
ncbi:MAG: GNAT family N-acetyltransferase [Alphaproteobacteria bacterium]|nr:GNAT family N-acetyltransferase [Alphaproteobacteria bacterium]